MNIIPVLKCSKIARTVTFYTQVLDFQHTEANAALKDPSYEILSRGRYELHVSSHSGDGVFGSVLLVRDTDLKALFQKFLKRGLDVTMHSDSPVHQGVIVQTWGTQEFYVEDPDGNTIRFVEG